MNNLLSKYKKLSNCDIEHNNVKDSIYEKSTISHKSLSKNELVQTIQEASQRYYTDGSSNLSDAQFDQMLTDLKVADPHNPLVTAVGHGYNVDKDSTYGQKKLHQYSLVGSLDKVHNWKELSNELKGKKVVYSLKLDGISCVLYYRNGILKHALTRGDGRTGIDITDKVLTIAPDVEMFYLDNNKDFTGAIRGELLMSYSNFEKYSKSNPEVKNPRNTTAGLVNRKDTSNEDLNLISLVVYTILASNVPFSSYLDVLKALKAWHDTVPY